MTHEKEFTVHSSALAAGVAAIVMPGTAGALTFRTVAAGSGRINTAEPNINIVDAAAPSGERREAGDPG